MTRQKLGYSCRLSAALAVVVAFGCLLAAPQGAKASLIGDDITVEATICADFGLGPCTDTVTVVDPAAEFTSTPNNPATNIGTNFLSFGAISFININDSSVDFFFDFDFPFFSQFIFTGLDWQDASAIALNPTFNVATGNLSSDPQFTNITTSTFTVSVDCGLAPLCSFATGVGFTVFLDPTHDGGGGTNDNNVTVPEPTSLLLLGCGLAGLVGFGRKKLSKKA